MESLQQLSEQRHALLAQRQKELNGTWAVLHIFCSFIFVYSTAIIYESGGERDG
jgi:hypothetical protein